MASKSQFDIENRFGPGGTEGTNYTVAITINGSVTSCTVTDDDDGDAIIAVGTAVANKGDTVDAESRAALGARRVLGIEDATLHCLTTTQKDTFTGSVRDGDQLVDMTLNQQETRQDSAWVGPVSSLATFDFAGTSLTLLDSHSGVRIRCDNASAITITLDTGLKAGFTCELEQVGVGEVQVSANGTTINSLNGDTKTAGQYAVVTLLQDGATDVFTFSGDTAA